MSSLQDKMYNHEVPPPSNTWEKIAASLDESEIENEFPSKLYGLETSPPVDTWGKITASLDEQNGFSTRLYNMEVAPPDGTWQKLDSSLHPLIEISAPVKKLPLFRYAAAALFIGAIAYGIIKITINNTDKGNSTLSKIVKDSSISDKNIVAESKQTQTVDTNTNEDDALEKSKKMFAKLDRPLKKAIRAITSSVIPNSADEDAIDPSLSQSIYAYADHVPDIADRYVMLLTPDGNIIRMSKKWSDLLCCVSGEDQDAGCKDQLKKWQEKMATSSLAPSPGNFMDILGLVNSLDENNDL